MENFLLLFILYPLCPFARVYTCVENLESSTLYSEHPSYYNDNGLIQITPLVLQCTHFSCQFHYSYLFMIIDLDLSLTWIRTAKRIKRNSQCWSSLLFQDYRVIFYNFYVHMYLGKSINLKWYFGMFSSLVSNTCIYGKNFMEWWLEWAQQI